MSKKLSFSISFLIIILGSILVRTYHYNEWLFFKWDQARDAILLAPAIQYGPEHLPLLGPRATKIGDDYLRLGPAYYYIQYLTGVIFNSTEPAIFAYSDLFFSIASILLLYLFLRLYFSKMISLLAMTMYSFSFLIVQYSRFSWNPNSVPFFTLLTFYGLLRFSIAKNFKTRLAWLTLWSLGFAIASQYHFFAFFVLTGVSGLFLGYYFVTTVLKDKIFKAVPLDEAKRGEMWLLKILRIIFKTIISKTSLVYIGTVLIIFGFLYTPVIISDLKTNGSNTKLFFKMFDESGRNDKTFKQKLIRNLREQGDNYALITTSFKHRSGMKADPITVGLGLFIIFSGLLLIKRELPFKGGNPKQRNFLILLLIWVSVFFIITIPASYQLRPRYFVPVFSVPFIIIALWFSVLEKRIVKHYNLLIIILTILILGSNGYGLTQWFREQADSQNKSFKTYRTLILRHRDGITLNQLENATNYLENLNSKSTVSYSSSAEYYLPLKYLFYLKDPSLQLTPQAVKNPFDLIGKEIIYVVNNDSVGHAGKKIRPYLQELSVKQFGQIFIHKMQIINKDELIKNTKLLTEKNSLLPPTKSFDNKKTERLFWRDIFGTSDDLDKILPAKKMPLLNILKP